MLNISLSIVQEELRKEFFSTTLPPRLEKFNTLVKGPFFMGDKVRLLANNECGYSLYIGLYGEALPEKGTFFKLQLRFNNYDRV